MACIFLWDQDDLVAQKICEIEQVDSYRTEGFILEGDPSMSMGKALC